jgi:opacity protein-like surface antigen
MRKLFILFGFALLVAATSKAQSFEVGGNYQYVHLNNGGGSSNGCQGFAGNLAANVNNWFGIAGDIGGCKVTGLPTGASGSETNYLFGPRITYHGSNAKFAPYFQTLMGGVHDSASATGFPTATANAFGWTLGGGVDYSLNPHWSLRAFQFEYFLTRFGGQSQNNLRIQAGLVYRWGSNRR